MPFDGTDWPPPRPRKRPRNIRPYLAAAGMMATSFLIVRGSRVAADEYLQPFLAKRFALSFQDSLYAAHGMTILGLVFLLGVLAVNYRSLCTYLRG